MTCRRWTAAIAALLVPVAAPAQDRAWDWGGHPMWWMWGMGGGLMMLMMLLFWGVVIAAIVLGIRRLLAPPDGRREDRALAILRERYARGEIGREEFEARRRDLEG